MSRFELLGRPNCHLCDEMETLLNQVLPGLGETFRKQDVDADPTLAERFGEVIPVLLRDGKPVAKVRVDRRQLERIVRKKRFWG